MIHTFKDFGIVNKAEIDVFLELSCFFDDLSIGVSGVLKSPTIFVLLSISPFMSVGNTRPPDLPLEKSVCRSESNS